MICSECKAPCDGQWIDFGVGAYEFWGARGCHSAWAFVSNCCEAEVIDEDGNHVTPGRGDEDE